MKNVTRPDLESIRAAARRLQGLARRTPLVPFEGPSGEAEIFLKLENLQPIGAFKVRGAGNAIYSLDRAELERGVFTASAGNMAQGVAWCARRLGVSAAAVVPDHAPRIKLDAIERLGARAVLVPFDEWWRVMEEHRYSGLEGRFIHPVSDAAVIAGNATIGLELLADLPDVGSIVVPFGGGGLSCGIAAAVKALRPEVRVVAAEVETAAPLSAAFSAGAPCTVDYRASFVDGIGAGRVLAEMWPLVRELIDAAAIASLERVAEAVRLLVERHQVVAEGAGAASLAVALADPELPRPVVCVVSGGNLDAARLATILSGEIPD